MVGGTGNDRLLGAQGFDTIYLGEGEDMALAGRGNDVVFSRARDGIVDRIVCGPGFDRVIAREEDDVDRSCERVRRLPAAATDTDPGDEDTPPPAFAAGDEPGGADSGDDPEDD
jgi:Ca2+-binding RTX toxin-like protein